MAEERDRAYWVWVTRPEYYLDADGTPRDDLDPVLSPGLSADGWWTCHEETRAGDLALLYRTGPMSDVAYVLEATSGARLLGRTKDDDVISWTRFVRLVREADAIWPDDYADDDQYDSFVEELAVIERQRDVVAAQFERLKVDPLNSDVLDSFDEVAGPFEAQLLGFRMRVEDAHEMVHLPLEYELGFGTGSFVCDWRPRYRFENPLELADLKDDKFLADNWNALRASFNRRAFRTTPEVWAYLINKAERSGDDKIKGAL